MRSMKSVWVTTDNCGGCTLCLVKTDGVTPARLKLLMVYDAGLDLQLLTTHVQLKLTGSPPVQRGTARRAQEHLNQMRGWTYDSSLRIFS